MISAVHHIGLNTPDSAGFAHMLAACGQFLQCDAHAPNAVRIEGPNVFIEARTVPGAAPIDIRPVHRQGIAHICLQATQIDTLIADLAPGGMAPLSVPTDLGTGFRYAYAHDASGVLYEIEGAPFARIAAPRAWVGHVAFVARDISVLSGFYASLLARAIDAPMRLRNDTRFDQVTGITHVDLRACWVRGLNIGLEFWQYLSPHTLPALNDSVAPGWAHLCFETDDVEATGHRIVQLGGATLDRRDHAGRQVFTDPEGNRLVLCSANERPNVGDLKHSGIVAEIARQYQGAQ